MTSASYDAGNELTNWNGTLISYDLNGNMLSDGSNAFIWNSRNQVASLNGVSLQYDAFGRRIQNAVGTSFLYDGANSAQELSGSTPTADLLSGGIDEWFSRADSSGTVTPLHDSLGSTIALVDGTGSIASSYSYDPFGNTASSGVVSSNPLQYTGRENEGNGVYFYRARYYSPSLQRFISQDPLGFLGGNQNLYGFVENDPINEVDPFGLKSYPTSGPIPGTSGKGWYRMDLRQEPAPNMHITWPNGDESIVSANGGFVQEHGGQMMDSPVKSYLPELRPVIKDFLKKVRLRFPEGFPTFGNVLNSIPTVTVIVDEWSADKDLAGRAKSANRSVHDEMCSEQFSYHERGYLSTTFGPVQSSVVCRDKML